MGKSEEVKAPAAEIQAEKAKSFKKPKAKKVKIVEATDGQGVL